MTDSNKETAIRKTIVEAVQQEISRALELNNQHHQERSRYLQQTYQI